MPRFGRLTRTALLASLIATPALAADQDLPKPTKDFSADATMHIEGGPTGQPMTIPGTVQYDTATKRFRREHTVMGQRNVILHDTEAEKVWILMPAMKSYIEAGKDEQSKKGVGVDESSLEALEPVGKEKVNGFDTTKYAASFENGSGHIWVTEDNITIKMAGTMSQNGQTVAFSNELTNLKLADQPSSDFEVPEDYSPFAIPDFSGMGGAAGGAAPGGAGGQMTPEQRQQMQQAQEQFKQQMQQMMEQMRQQQGAQQGGG